MLEGYYNANWIFNIMDTKSMSGYVFTLSGGAISWKSTKKTCEAHSTIRAEFISLEKVSAKVEWLRNLLVDIPLWNFLVHSVYILYDNQTTITRSRIIHAIEIIDIYA